MNSGASAPSMPFPPRGRGSWPRAGLDRVETWLEAERDQLPLWLPVMLCLGIGGWFVLPDRPSWTALIAGALGLALGGVALGLARRAGFAMLVAGLAVAGGCALAWTKAEWVAASLHTWFAGCPAASSQ